MKDIHKCIEIILRIVQSDREENFVHTFDREDINEY